MPKQNIPRWQTEIDALRDSNGGVIQPQQIVDWARENEDSDLHGRFEWDDARAGEAYRRDQARRLLRIRVQVRGTTVTAPIHVSVETDEPRGYRRTVDVMTDEGMRYQLLFQAYRDAQAWAERYRHLEEYAKVVESIDSMAAP